DWQVNDRKSLQLRDRKLRDRLPQTIFQKHRNEVVQNCDETVIGCQRGTVGLRRKHRLEVQRSSLQKWSREHAVGSEVEYAKTLDRQGDEVLQELDSSLRLSRRVD